MTNGAERSAQDILSRSLRLTLGGEERVLAVLFIAGNERWREYERAQTSEFITSLEIAGNDPRQILAEFGTQVDLQLDLLYAYDTDCGHRVGVLPAREVLKESLYEDELEMALREVVKAANPKAVAAASLMAQVMKASSERSSSSPPSTAGTRRKSARH